jgi:TonB family protein
MNSNISPFSFYKWIFIPEQYSIEESEMIINHEKVHIRKKHYLDRLFIELVCIFLWFNPVIWILLNEIKKIHEYEADYFVAFNKDIIGDYLQLLYKSATGVSFSAATLNFNVSIFMERIVMITKERSSKFAYVKQFLLMPIIFLLLINFSFSENQSSTENPKAKDGSTKVDLMPVFKGDLSQIMQSELKYPDAARKKGIQGKVVLGLYISENGTVSKIEVAESVEKSLDDEAVRVAGLLKNWEPAKSKNKSVAAKVFLPVQFKLN